MMQNVNHTLTKSKGYRVNFLAHSLFAQGNSERLAGQFAGDFVRGSDLSQYREGIQLGIRMHRFIDHYTDHHAAAVQLRDLFKPPVRRFAGIVTDVVFDHYLARDWSRYSSVPLAEHVAHVHQSLEEHQDELPDNLNRFVAFLKREKVLESNVSFDSVELTLQRLSQRSASFSPLASGAAIALEHEAEILSVFKIFFPELIQAANEHRAELIN